MLRYRALIRCSNLSSVFNRSASFKYQGTHLTDTVHLNHLKGSKSLVDNYWINQLKLVNKPSAVALISLLSPNTELGCDIGKQGKNTFFSFFVNEKKLHPHKILLMRCGDFYETYGIDSVMLVEHAGLNPMAGKCKAGCPVANIQSVLDCLTNVGLSVAVYEELSDVVVRKGALKTRSLVQIVSSASRTYLYNLALRDDEVNFEYNQPIVGIRQTLGGHGGYTLFELRLDEKKMTVMERLSPEAVRSIIDVSGHSDPVYIHGDSSELSFITERATVEKIEGYSEKIFESQMLNRVQRLYELPRIDDIAIHTRDFQSQLQPRPIYTSTARQIGLLRNDNVPSLIEAIVSKSDKFTNAFWSRWLLIPPPYIVANNMHSLLRLLNSISYTLPVFKPTSVGTIVSMLSVGEANVSVLRDLWSNVHHLRSLLTSELDEFKSLVKPLLAITTYQTDIPADRMQLILGCERVISSVSAVIAPDDCVDKAYSDPHGRIPDDFFQRNEDVFRRHVLSCHPAIAELYEQIANAGRTLCDAVKEDFVERDGVIHHDILNNAVAIRLVSKRTKKMKDSESEMTDNLPLCDDVSQGVASNDIDDSEVTGIINEIISESGVNEQRSGVKYKPFIDRKGKALQGRYTTARVNKALARYVHLTSSAPQCIKEILKVLSAELYGRDLVAIQQTTHLAVILRAADAHTVTARQKRWSLPCMTSNSSDEDNDVACTTEERALASEFTVNGYAKANPCSIVELSPYWIDRNSAVLNDVELNGMYLLTAPNMSGKSTLMRSLLVSALLANCGMFVPCAFASIPRYDTFFLRTTSHDAPSEGKSAFALEMDDMRVILRDCTSRSLVMVDELGKGTSSRDGSALAGALLETLDHRGVQGIFATHLHELFLLSLQLRNVKNKRMSVTEDCDGRHPVWTYKLEDGVCTDSKALHTAREYRVDEAIIRRAEQLGREFDESLRGVFSAVRNATCPSNITTETTVSPQTVLHVDVENLSDIELLFSSIVGGTVTRVDCNSETPAALEGHSCVYILHIYNPVKPSRQSSFYVGETESIRQRLKQHREHYESEGCKVDCLVSTVAGKSTARSLEPILIGKLKKKGYDVERSTDARHKLFGGGK